jgi:tetraacyldisaccharide 4'-kinase
VEAHALPDHHRFTAGDIDWPDALPVIMTAKDAVKCVGFAKERHWYLPVTAVLARDDEQWLLERILALGQDGGRLRD